MIERYLHLHSHKYYDTIIILEFLQFLLSAFKNVLRKKTAFKPKTIETRKGAFSPFCDLRITIHIPDHNGWDPCEVLLSFPFNFHWFRRRICLNEGVKLTLREGEGSKTWIHKTTNNGWGLWASLKATIFWWHDLGRFQNCRSKSQPGSKKIYFKATDFRSFYESAWFLSVSAYFL